MNLSKDTIKFAVISVIAIVFLIFVFYNNPIGKVSYELKTLKAQNDEILKEKKELEEQNKKLKLKNEELFANLKKSDENIIILDSKILEKEKEIKKSENKLSVATQEYNKLKSQLDEFKTSNTIKTGDDLLNSIKEKTLK